MTYARCLVILALLLAGFAIVFVVWPSLDLAVAELFHHPAAGFALAGHPFWEGVLLANKAASLAFIVFALVGLTVSILRRATHGMTNMRYFGFVVLLYLLGPGVLVNGVLKRSFGRARPVQNFLFGGDGPFTGPWQISDYCSSACSFVSAESAVATALAVGLAVGALWFIGRVAKVFNAMAMASVFLLFLTSVQRIGSGRHFLSDAIFAVLLIASLGVLLASLILPRAARFSATQIQGQTG